MLTCEELESFLDDYLDGLLPAGARRRFEWHLRLCPDCRRYLEAYRRTVVLYRRAFEWEAALREETPEDLARAILAAREGGR